MITIEITCTKCGKKSSNQYWFRSRFSFVYSDGTLNENVHLCLSCQGELYQVKMETIAQFLGEEEVREWREYEGVL